MCEYEDMYHELKAEKDAGEWGRKSWENHEVLSALGSVVESLDIDRLSHVQLYLSSHYPGRHFHNVVYFTKEYGFSSTDGMHLFFHRIPGTGLEKIMTGKYLSFDALAHLHGNVVPKEASQVGWDQVIKKTWPLDSYKKHLVKIECSRSQLNRDRKSSHVGIKDGVITHDKAAADVGFDIRYLSLFYGRELTCWTSLSERVIYFFDKSEMARESLEDTIDNCKWALVVMPVRLQETLG